MALGAALDNRPDQFLDRLQGRPPLPDQQPKVMAGDVDEDTPILVDLDRDARRRPEGFDQAPREGLRLPCLLLHRYLGHRFLLRLACTRSSAPSSAASAARPAATGP